MVTSLVTLTRGSGELFAAYKSASAIFDAAEQDYKHYPIVDPWSISAVPNQNIDNDHGDSTAKGLDSTPEPEPEEEPQQEQQEPKPMSQRELRNPGHQETYSYTDGKKRGMIPGFQQGGGGLSAKERARRHIAASVSSKGANSSKDCSAAPKHRIRPHPRSVGERQFDSKVGPSSGSSSQYTHANVNSALNPRLRLQPNFRFFVDEDSSILEGDEREEQEHEQHGQEKFEDDAYGDASGWIGPFQTYPEDALLMDKPLKLRMYTVKVSNISAIDLYNGGTPWDPQHPVVQVHINEQHVGTAKHTIRGSVDDKGINAAYKDHFSGQLDDQKF